MRKFFSARTLIAFMIFGIVFLAAACRGPAPTITPAPPTAKVSTPLPPAPIAPPLTETPTEVPTATPPPTATTVIPTAVPTSVPTNTPTLAPTNAPTSALTKPPATALANRTVSSSGTTVKNPTRVRPTNAPVPLVDRGPLTGLYVAGLRHEPNFPVSNEPIKFYATLVNRSGKEQHYPVCAEIFRPDEKKRFGSTNCANLTILIGTHEVFIGTWNDTGIKECLPRRARAILREQGSDIDLVFTTQNGGVLWIDFKVCPQLK